MTEAEKAVYGEPSKTENEYHQKRKSDWITTDSHVSEQYVKTDQLNKNMPERIKQNILCCSCRVELLVLNLEKQTPDK